MLGFVYHQQAFWEDLIYLSSSLWDRIGKMKAHGVYMYAWLLVGVFFSLLEPSYGDVGNLLQGKKGFRETFSIAGKWFWFSQSYLACQSLDLLLLRDNLTTTGINEIKVEVEFNIYNPSTSRKQLRNKTIFSIAVITNRYDEYTARGTPSKSSRDQKLKAIKLLELHSEYARIGIKALDNENCLIIYSVNITYNFCPEKTVENVAHFPRTHSPSNGSSAAKVEGSCSFNNGRPVAFCESSGNWFNDTVPCACGPGSIATASGCVKLTRAIQDIKAMRQSNTQALLSWRRQAIPSIQYKVVCKKCLRGLHVCDENCSGVVINLWPNDSKKKGYIITGLEQGSGYKCTVFAWIVYSVNGSKNQESWNRSVILKELPSQVKKLKFTSQSPNQIALSWQPSHNYPRNNVSYNVTCEVYCSQENCSQGCSQLKFTPSRNNLLRTNVTVSGFGQQGNRYLFKIFAKNRWHKFAEDGPVEWNFIGINFTAESKQMIPVPESNTFNVVDVIIGVSVLILAVIVTVIVTRCYNRWKVRKRSMGMDPDSLDRPYEVPLTTIRSTSHYVDPSSYDSVKNMLHQFTKQLNEKNLKTEEMIGEGEFGVVWRGYLDLPGKERVTVAVKCLRSGLSAKLRRDFLSEASVMGQFEDPNVISLHGVVVKKNIVKIVMEYMSNGSLDKYLVNNNGRLTTLQLLGMARGIASGMQYLSGRNFIHRDLAARNILVDENLTCKVSDFGLTREICQTSNYETRGGKIPIRWTAPEVIKHKKSFIASDVWSFGVVLWEVMSFGQRPYWDWDNFQVLQEIESGYRLPAPLKCPKSVHSLMIDCWQKERTLRPLFSYIVDKLDEWIRSPETVSDSPSMIQKRNKPEDIDSESPIQHWLDSIKMGKYTSNFNKAGYNRLSQLSCLTEDDLLRMEIRLVGHRHKIHQSIPLVAKRS